MAGARGSQSQIQVERIRAQLDLQLLPLDIQAVLTPGMAASVHDTHLQVSARQHPHPDGHGRPSHSINSSATLIEPSPRPPCSNERPSIELKISSRGANILNAVVVDSAGRPLYSISSDESRTALLAQRDNSKVATIDWDRSSPRMVFRGKKVKCKEWLPRTGPDTESRMFTHGDSQLKWMQQPDRGFLIPVNRPGLVVARWRTESRADGLRIQIFHEVLVEPGLLEAILLSIILLQSGNAFGDTLPSMADLGPRHYGIAIGPLCSP
ncbi:hypothetical protein V8E53_009155 [Lactarius tabidus]